MNSNNKIQKELKEILSFKNDAEKLAFEADMIHLDVMSIIAKLMEKIPMKPSELAKELRVNKSYVSQLFAGDKIINFKTLAKFQRIFDVRFKLNIKTNEIEKLKQQIKELRSSPQEVRLFLQGGGNSITVDSTKIDSTKEVKETEENNDNLPITYTSTIKTSISRTNAELG